MLEDDTKVEHRYKAFSDFGYTSNYPYGKVFRLIDKGNNSI